ncbi:MAG TPA: alpha/beta hydrolase [Actinoplanes sp.]|nr:alpha/beta hydrolase [Actinoplanes sp.]
MHLFSVDDVPAVLWTPAGIGTPPLIFVGHGGGQHKQHPAVMYRAERFVAAGFAVVSADIPNHGDRAPDERLNQLAAGVRSGADLARFQALAAEQIVPEWQAVLDAVQEQIGAGPVGYWGVSAGCGLGVPFVANEPRVRAAVLGLGGASANAEVAARITVPVEFLVQWDDERVPRAESLALFEAFGSSEKTLHANPGKHADRLPDHELDSQARFFARHLTLSGCR